MWLMKCMRQTIDSRRIEEEKKNIDKRMCHDTENDNNNERKYM